MTPSIAAVSHRVGRSATRWWRSIVPLMLTIVVAASGTTAAASDREEALAASPQILVVFSDDPSQSWIREMTDGMNVVTDERTGNAPAWYFEYLDALRFQDAEHEREFGAAMRDKYRDRRLDLIVPIAGNAITFVASPRLSEAPLAMPSIRCVVPRLRKKRQPPPIKVMTDVTMVRPAIQ